MPLAGWFAIAFVVIAAAAIAGMNSLGLAEAGLIALILVFLLLFFILLQSVIAGPLKRLARSVKRFSEQGEPEIMPMPMLPPKEVRALVGSFAELIEHVNAARKHDRELSRVKSDFISTAAHQLRTPLTGIRWALEALAAGTLDENQKSLVDSAADKSRELVAIVGTLLDISAIESGKYKYQFERIEVAPLLTSVVQDFTQKAQERGLTLSYVPVEVAIPTVRADRERIRWVLNNLVDNAIAYTPKDGSVRLSAQPVAGTVLIHVRDTGIGIDPADRANIFERFFRGGNAVKKENGGNGLGLYIARTIASDHGGDLTFEANTEGPGTTFTLSLPSA